MRSVLVACTACAVHSLYLRHPPPPTFPSSIPSPPPPTPHVTTVVGSWCFAGLLGNVLLVNVWLLCRSSGSVRRRPVYVWLAYKATIVDRWLLCKVTIIDRFTAYTVHTYTLTARQDTRLKVSMCGKLLNWIDLVCLLYSTYVY